VHVVERPAPPGAERAFLGFETLTLVPIDRALIDESLLDPEETRWLDSYHARIRAEITPHVDPATALWLERATKPLKRP
jgi:Xaa-Pro aminopeptidase